MQEEKRFTLLELFYMKETLENSTEYSYEEIRDTMDSLEAATEDKVNFICWLNDRAEATSDFAKKKIELLKKEKKSAENTSQNINQYLTSILDNYGIKEFQTKKYRLKPRNYRASTVITNEDKLPVEYKKVIEEVKIDKTAIYKALKDGSEVPGAHLEPNRKTVIK